MNPSVTCFTPKTISNNWIYEELIMQINNKRDRATSFARVSVNVLLASLFWGNYSFLFLSADIVILYATIFVISTDRLTFEVDRHAKMSVTRFVTIFHTCIINVLEFRTRLLWLYRFWTKTYTYIFRYKRDLTEYNINEMDKSIVEIFLWFLVIEILVISFPSPTNKRMTQ